MFRRPRHRRGPYSMAPAGPVSPRILRFVGLGTVVLVVFFSGRWVLGMMGIGNNLQRASAMLLVDDGAQISVSLDGGGLTRADDTLKLYGGDRVVSTTGRFSLVFFDGTILRGENGTDITIRDSSRGAQESAIEARLAKGSVWLKTPAASVFTGSIIRSLQTPSYAMTAPSGTEAVAGEGMLAVLESEGIGVAVNVDGAQTVYIGEGQELALPAENERGEDMYAYRSPLTAATLENPLLKSSRQTAGGVTRPIASVNDQVPEQTDVLIITEPQDNALVTTRTIKVTGTVGEGVARIRVNGYQATLDSSRRTFTQELALGDDEETEIRIEALDERGLTIQEARRTVRRNIEPPPPPSITQPAPSGAVYRMSREEFEIRGTAPAGVAGIVVNDYRLQLFKKGNTEWSYLASVRLGNAVRGENIFDVWSIDDANNRSAPVRLVIRIEDGAEGIVSQAEGTSAASSASSVNPADLPSNAPLQPGSVTVTGPVPGTSATMTGTELVLEGTSPATAASVWVNDYKLQLFTPSKQTWTYIAREEWGTLKPGINTFTVIARDSDNKILDTVTYTVTKE